MYDLYDVYDLHDVDDLYDLFPPHDLELSRQICSRSCMIQVMLPGGGPYGLHDLQQ